MKPFSAWLWAALAAIVGLKLALVAGLPVHIVFSPHDDSLYLSRAVHLLNDGSFGPYDSRVLAKLPGISIWLAGLRGLGLPYLLTMNVLYAGAGLYALLALRRCGVHALVLLAIWALYLLNPVTMSEDWLRILRESLSTTLLVAIFGAALHILVRIREGGRYWPHLLVLSAILAFSMVVREEDKLLWGMLVLFTAAAIFDGIGQERSKSWSVRTAAPLLIVPALAALAGFTVAGLPRRRYAALAVAGVTLLLALHQTLRIPGLPEIRFGHLTVLSHRSVLNLPHWTRDGLPADARPHPHAEILRRIADDSRASDGTRRVGITTLSHLVSQNYFRFHTRAHSPWLEFLNLQWTPETEIRGAASRFEYLVRFVEWDRLYPGDLHSEFWERVADLTGPADSSRPFRLAQVVAGPEGTSVEIYRRADLASEVTAESPSDRRGEAQ